MLYEVSTGAISSIVTAGNSREAKKEFAKQRRGTRPSGYYLSSLQASKIDVDYPDTHYQGCNEELFQQLEGKDVLIYDEHHGTSVRLRKATAAAIEHFVDEYSTIIVL